MSYALTTVRTGSPCTKCEGLPESASASGDLHCWFPTAHVAGKVRAVFSRLGVSSTATIGDGLGFALGPDIMAAAVEAIDAALSDVEREDTRALLTPAGVPPGAADLPRVEPLGRFVTRARSGWLVELLRERRLTSHFQPIACASDPTSVYGHEALLRGVSPDGTFISPKLLFDTARGAGLMFQLDLAARRSAIANAHMHGLQGALFVNFAPTAIYDPAACLRTTVAAIDNAGIARGSVVFEIVETERAHDVSHLRRILDYYREAGFRIALDDVGSGYSSLNLIHLLRPDILKLDMELVRGVDDDPYKARIAANLLDVANSLGIDALAEGIETEGELAWVQAHGAKYVQGYLLGRPAAAPVGARAGVMATATATDQHG